MDENISYLDISNEIRYYMCDTFTQWCFLHDAQINLGP